MKNSILTFLILASHIALIAQTEVTLQINHKLGDSDFEFNSEVENSLGEAFDISRIDYYLSSFIIYHDAGLETEVEDVYVISKGDETTVSVLGDFDITQIDSISFGIGIPFDVNHTDPSTYPEDHPLSFQSPSMHWGWNAGFRFVCMEGYAGSNLDELYQIHALGDDNYHTQTIVVSATASNNDIYIGLDANYIEALNGISVNGGLINHGTSDEAADLLYNFRDHVFSVGVATVGINDYKMLEYQIFPNPVSSDGIININGIEDVDQIQLIDLSGRIVQQWNLNNNQLILDSQNPGTYVLVIYTNDGHRSHNKIVIQ